MVGAWISTEQEAPADLPAEHNVGLTDCREDSCHLALQEKPWDMGNPDPPQDWAQDPTRSAKQWQNEGFPFPNDVIQLPLQAQGSSYCGKEIAREKSGGVRVRRDREQVAKNPLQGNGQLAGYGMVYGLNFQAPGAWSFVS